MVQPTEAELQRRKLVRYNVDTVTNVSNTEYPHFYPGEDHSWDVEKFRNSLRVQFHSSAQFESSFSLIGLDASIANAFRRILIAEVPTVAIETIYMAKNTSLIQDEVLAARFGLVPLQGSHEGIHWMRWVKKPKEDEKLKEPEEGKGGSKDGENQQETSALTDYNTATFSINVECTWREGGKERFQHGESDPEKLYEHSNVYARDITFTPAGRQYEYFTGDGAFKPANPDILLAKLRPGQAIVATMHAHKGIGADHAKFSPVATASYRLMPSIEILSPIIGADAKKFARCFPRGVIGLRPVTAEEAAQGGPYEGQEGQSMAYVADAMRDTVSRECLRHEEFKNKVRLGRVRDHFICSVESVGQFESDELFVESVKLLKAKCVRMKRAMARMATD
ncbi:putative DNA-directed RNA polymerase I and III subunit Rpc40 [Trichodelitschia bisporula]|uniref:Putative DNA-directed RNA polymerase I and III subunit Rpc40 n=1 Tax=Trichodelitschia bisporula TaxID=703511 RepID=A0A6G1HX67_9PEZI|nr:putative DNA-directed RNA polymerase I and III subunit Rpc40 [Trichodelitschia bisporula]